MSPLLAGLATCLATSYDPVRMKKKLLIIFASLATVLAVTSLIVVYKLNDLVQGFRPQIEHQLSVALGNKVELGEISASLFPTCHLSVRDVKVLAPDGRSTSMSLAA